MKLQLALDIIDKKKALAICKKANEYIDIIEIGTPFVKKEGLGVIKEFKKFGKPIVADLKIMDTGFLEAEMAFKAGADITTVCASAEDSTIKGAVKAAHKYKKKILVDLIAIKDVAKRARTILKLKPDYICIHTAIDVQKKQNPLLDLKKVSKIISKKVKIAVAGGIKPKSINKLKKYDPEIIIVGSAITKDKNPANAAKKLKEAMVAGK